MFAFFLDGFDFDCFNFFPAQTICAAFA